MVFFSLLRTHALLKDALLGRHTDQGFTADTRQTVIALTAQDHLCKVLVVTSSVRVASLTHAQLRYSLHVYPETSYRPTLPTPLQASLRASGQDHKVNSRYQELELCSFSSSLLRAKVMGKRHQKTLDKLLLSRMPLPPWLTYGTGDGHQFPGLLRRKNVVCCKQQPTW